MAKKLVGVSPYGLRQYHDYDPSTGTVYRIYEQDVEESRELGQAVRNDESVSRTGIKNGWWQTAHYDDVDIIDMMRRFGVNPMTHPREALSLAKVHYPHCLRVPKAALERKESSPLIIIKK